MIHSDSFDYISIIKIQSSYSIKLFNEAIQQKLFNERRHSIRESIDVLKRTGS